MFRVLFCCLVVLATCAGCVERRIYIVTQPADVDVYIDGEFIGKTREKDHPEGPLYANFIFYGKREYTLRKPGYATLSGEIDLEVPWYEYPPIDFFAEVLTPWIIVDEHFVEAKLEKAKPADVDTLYRSALDYRRRSRPQDRLEYASIVRLPAPVPPHLPRLPKPVKQD